MPVLSSWLTALIASPHAIKIGFTFFCRFDGAHVDESDRRTIDHIERFGCSVLHIAAEDELPPFTYSVGITRTSSAPEVVVVGLKREIAHYVVNEYNRRVRAGESLVPGQRYSGFIDGFEVEGVQVDRSFYEEYFGHNLWLYQGPHFEVLQLVYPNTSGVWPWQADANEGFKSWQPVLGKLGHVYF